MDDKAIKISITLIALTLIFVLAQNKVMIAITSAMIFALMVKGFVEMYKEVKAILEADKVETKEELRKNVFK